MLTETGVTTTYPVIAGLVPAIHGSNDLSRGVSAQWIAGPSPAMTSGEMSELPSVAPVDRFVVTPTGEASHDAQGLCKGRQCPRNRHRGCYGVGSGMARLARFANYEAGGAALDFTKARSAVMHEKGPHRSAAPLALGAAALIRACHPALPDLSGYRTSANAMRRHRSAGCHPCDFQ